MQYDIAFTAPGSPEGSVSSSPLYFYTVLRIITFRKRNLLATICFMLLFTLNVFSRADSPCGCSSLDTIGSHGVTINLSSITALASNHCYYIAYILVVDVPAVWNNVRIKVALRGQIQVEDDLNIVDSYISGCNSMWKGFRTTGGINLSVTGSAIEDAEIGLKLADGIAFTCRYNDFIDDYIGIGAGSPFE